MRRKTMLSLYLLGSLSVAGCGGGGGTTPVSPTITSVSASCNPTSLQAHQTLQTSQCSATVIGTGSYSSAVSWSANYGTITSAGVYTAPATVPTPPTATVTATSTEDMSKSGQATITITAARAITLTPQYPIVSMAEAGTGSFPVLINAPGIQTGDVISVTNLGITTTTTITADMAAASAFYQYINLAGVPSFFQLTCGSPTSANAVCNTAWIAVTTDQQELAESQDSTVAYFNPGLTFAVQKFLLSNGTNEGSVTLQGSASGISNTAIAVDGGASGTGALVANVAYQFVASTTGNATTGYIPSNGNGLASIVARNGYGYLTEPNAGDLEQFTISSSSGLAAGSSVLAGDGPYAMDAATVNSADAIAVYSGQDQVVRLFDNTPALVSSSAALTNITPFLTVQNTNTNQATKLGGWPLRILGSGTAAGTVALLSSYDNLLDLLTIDAGNNLTLTKTVSFAANQNPYLIAPDPMHGAFLVVSANTATGMTTLQSISATSPYTVTTITPNPALPAGFLASGILVSDNGNSIYLAGFNTTSTTATPLLLTIANP